MSEEKKTFLQKISEQLLKLDSQLDELKGKSGKVTDGLKEEYKEQINKLSSRKDDLRKKLNEFKDSGGDAWESIKEGLEGAAKELKSAFNEAIVKFKGEADRPDSDSAADSENKSDENQEQQ